MTIDIDANDYKIQVFIIIMVYNFYIIFGKMTFILAISIRINIISLSFLRYPFTYFGEMYFTVPHFTILFHKYRNMNKENSNIFVIPYNDKHYNTLRYPSLEYQLC